MEENIPETRSTETKAPEKQARIISLRMPIGEEFAQIKEERKKRRTATRTRGGGGVAGVRDGPCIRIRPSEVLLEPMGPRLGGGTMAGPTQE